MKNETITISVNAKRGTATFIDVETTGLNPFEDEIIELAMVAFEFDRETGEILRIVDEYTGLSEPSIPIKKKASEVHGIYKRHVVGKSLDENKIVEILRKTELFIAHNAEFDKGFCDNILRLDPPLPWYCSMDGIPWNEYGFRSKGLQNLLKYHGITTERAHRANNDVKSAIELLSRKNKNGHFYLKELLKSKPINQYQIDKYHGTRKELAASYDRTKIQNKVKDKQTNMFSILKQIFKK